MLRRRSSVPTVPLRYSARRRARERMRFRDSSPASIAWRNYGRKPAAPSSARCRWEVRPEVLPRDSFFSPRPSSQPVRTGSWSAPVSIRHWQKPTSLLRLRVHSTARRSSEKHRVKSCDGRRLRARKWRWWRARSRACPAFMSLRATEAGACSMAQRLHGWPSGSRVRRCTFNFRLPMSPATTVDKTMEKLVSLAKRRGFVFQSSEIYGGLGSVWDYGPLGVELKKNIKERWWRSMVHERHDIEGLDAAILMHPKVWEASGHVSGFTDPLVDCKHCKNRFRADDPKIKGTPGQPDAQCPACGSKGTLTAPRQFNLMFKTFMGPVEDQAAVVYLRPETAQGIYVNYLNVLQSSRQKIPFGVAQIGKAFRNEITPGNFIFRTREFEQMEMQFFVKPGSENEWFETWRAERMKWVEELGIRPEKLRWHQHGPDELAHYAKDAYEIQYEVPFGWNEFEGIHNRTDFDLSNHQRHAGKKLDYLDPKTNERFIPYVVETSAGADRTTLVVLCDAYREEEVSGAEAAEGGEQRVVLRLKPSLAPLKAAVFPLVNKDGMPELAHRIHDDLRRRFNVFYDDGGSIGRRYRRQDEAGTPFGITIDGQSTQDQTVTVRDRDTLKQDRVAAGQLVEYLNRKLAG